MVCLFFFFNDTATTEIYTLSLHDALPICYKLPVLQDVPIVTMRLAEINGRTVEALQKDTTDKLPDWALDRKSTRLNSSHANISYAVFCLKKKNRILSVQTLIHLRLSFKSP